LIFSQLTSGLYGSAFRLATIPSRSSRWTALNSARPSSSTTSTRERIGVVFGMSRARRCWRFTSGSDGGLSTAQPEQVERGVVEVALAPEQQAEVLTPVLVEGHDLAV
jgi:hypothetical protein